MRKIFYKPFWLSLLIMCSLQQVYAATVRDLDSNTVYATGYSFSGTVSAVVDVVGAIDSYTLGANATLEIICAHALSITNLTMGQGSTIKFRGPALATIGNNSGTIALHSTGAAVFSFANGGLTLGSLPTNVSTLTVFEFLGSGATLTCDTGAEWTCELRMTAGGVFSSTSCTKLAGLISGPGALTLPPNCADITSTGSGRGSTANSIVPGCAFSFTDANIFSTGIQTLLYNITYAGVASPPKPATGKVYANQPACSAFVLGASVTINGGLGLIIKQLTDTIAFNPTCAGILEIGTYNPLGSNMTVSSGTTTIKKGQLNSSFQVHRAGASIIKVGG